MPNWVYNRIVFSEELTTEQKQKIKLMKMQKGMCRYYTPMPIELEGGRPPTHMGGDNWYDFAIREWGTKWGCVDFDFDFEDEIIAFDTAWSPISNKILNLLAKDFPNFTYEFEEETEWGGEIEYENGEVIRAWDYTEPNWEYYEGGEDGNEYQITELRSEHPLYEDDGLGFYYAYSRDYLGETLEEAIKNYN